MKKENYISPTKFPVAEISCNCRVLGMESARFNSDTVCAYKAVYVQIFQTLAPRGHDVEVGD